jgi:CheY-like chemotaxis protein
MKQRVFTPFLAAKDQSRRKGVRLVVSSETVKKHSRAATVESRPGQGAAFVLYLPLVQESWKKEITVDMQQKSTKEKARILLVEDEEMIRNVASAMLERLGYAVYVCDNGQDAVDHYREEWQNIDLIILDVIMPELDGEETFIAMQEINPALKVLVSSGYSLDDKTQNIIQKGAKGFIQKPYRKGALSVKVAEVLGASATLDA